MCDNCSCIAIAKNVVFHARTKHIEVHYHFVRELILDGILELMFCSTNDNVADVFMKALPQLQLEHLEHLTRHMGVGPIPAIQTLLARTGLMKEDIDVWEVKQQRIEIPYVT